MSEDFQKKLNNLIERFKSDIAGIRTGRVNTALVENIAVEMYEKKMPIKSLAAISVQQPNAIIIEPWDKTALAAIEKAIQMEPELGLSPNRDGNKIRLVIPPLTEERRRQLAKVLGVRREEVRVAARRERDEALKKIKTDYTDKKMSEDEYLRMKNNVDKEIKKFEEDIEKIYNTKEKEILS